MNFKLFLCCCVSFSFEGGVADPLKFQENDSADISILEQIESQRPSLLTSMGKARNLILTKLTEKKIQDIDLIYPALKKEYPNKSFFLLWPYEESELAFITNSWDVLLDTSRYQPLAQLKLMNRIAPEPDDFGRELSRYFQENKEQIYGQLLNARLDPVSRDFLLIYLRYLESNSSQNLSFLPPLNTMATEYLQKYPQSPYSNFVRENVRYVVKPSIYGFGGGFSTALFFPLGEFGESASFRIPFGFHLEMHLMKTWLRGELLGAFGPTLNRGFDYKANPWLKGDDIALTYAEAQFGVVVHESVKFSLEPFISWGTLELSNETLEKELDDESRDHIVYGESMGAGLQVNFYTRNDNHPGAMYMGIVLGARKQELGKKIPQFKGNEIYTEFILGIRGRKWKRDL